MKKNIFLFLCLAFIQSSIGFSQKDTTQYHLLETVTVSIQRLNGDLLKMPASITNSQISKIKNARQRISVNEYLNEIPGLFSLNSNNFAQDLRVSIRGFGARATFGIRGVKLLVDGIPETTPDGQGQVDNLDLGLIQKLEIIRGPSSGLYGNASGGIISIQTKKKVDYNFLELGTSFGSFNTQRHQLKGGWTNDTTHLVFNVNHIRTNGYRDHSGMQQSIFSGNLFHQFNPRSNFQIILNYTNSPKADDPGGIDLEALMGNRKEARDRNLQFQAGESIHQFKAAILFEQYIKKGQLRTNAFYVNREFYGLLPFNFGGIVELNRHYGGHGSNYTFYQHFSGNKQSTLQIGYDLQFQQDHRQRFENIDGTQGELTFDQVESFTNFGLYLINHLELSERLLVSLNLRRDINHLKAKDQQLSNGDDSGSQQFNSFNIGLGSSYKILVGLVPYVNYSTSFETPTLSELSANPASGTEGFNNNLDPQEARNLEIGLKGLINGKFKYELVYFNIRTQNEIIPFEINDSDFFRNAGKTVRNGLESNIQFSFFKNWVIAATYTFSDFKFRDYRTQEAVFDGEHLPGIPQHFGSFSLRYIDPEGLFFKLLARLNGKLFTNDANTVEDQGYMNLNINIGYEKRFSNWIFTPFFGIKNLLNTNYNDNIRINAFGGRYYEPAAGINVFGGINIKISGRR